MRDASPAATTRRRVRFEPEVGRAKPGRLPERLLPGQGRIRRFSNGHGFSVAVHPDDTGWYVRRGVMTTEGRAFVGFVEREAFVDVCHFYFGKGGR